MNYIELSFTFPEEGDFADIVAARLNEIEFESYVETKNGVSTGVTTENMMINLDRAILVYEDGSGSNDNGKA